MIVRINRYIVGCKFVIPVAMSIFAIRINRYIVGCKLYLPL